ncbi:hypothetical protein JL722_7677 [Aureococcus anophagefferens]|nr:hypothetical protein JL722_7677 [Aureococcus anophagefferens]
MQVAGEAPAPQPSSSKAVQRFFAFICVSTLCRAFEAGICASMMPKIADSLRLSYVQEGVVASAPDYGIVPAGFLAILLFERVDAYPVLVLGNLFIGAVALWCAAFPSYGSLVTARAVGGLAWGCSMVHYPAWINAKGPAASKTMWLALSNVVLLGGILVGFAVGGACASKFPEVTWDALYGVEAAMMGAAGLAAATFHADLVQVVPRAGRKASADAGERSELLLGDAERPRKPRSPWAKCRSVLACRLFAWTVGAGSFVCGTVGFLLYFIAQVAEAQAPTWSPAARYGTISARTCGGYENFSKTHAFTIKCAFAGVVAIACMPIALVWVFLFAGAAPTAAINGIVLAAAPPDASVYASGIQFAVQNGAKLLVPLVGGAVIDAAGLLPGFDAVLLFSACGYLVCAIAAKRAADKHRPWAARDDADDAGDELDARGDFERFGKRLDEISARSPASPRDRDDTIL